MIDRFVINRLENSISKNSAVALLGPRRLGKTTLAKEIAASREAIYIDLKSPRDLLLLEDPVGFLQNNRDKLIILDEVQRVPNLFMILRGLIDENRQRGRHGSQFLIISSLEKSLWRQDSESLAGRISYIDMYGLNILEHSDIEKAWFLGGFPQSYLSSEDSIEWLDELIVDYLERDLPQMGLNIPAHKLRILWAMLAHLQGETVNVSRLSAQIEVSRRDVNHYIDILAGLLLLRKVEPWHINVKKRLVKSPRFYVRDSGIMHRLLEINNSRSLLRNPVVGKSWEGFVIENIHSVLPRLAKTYFYRTAVGAEIDLVIKMSNGEIWAIEIKYGISPKLSKHYSRTCDDVGATHKFVVYGGDDEFSVGKGVYMISLKKIMEKIIISA